LKPETRATRSRVPGREGQTAKMSHAKKRARRKAKQKGVRLLKEKGYGNLAAKSANRGGASKAFLRGVEGEGENFKSKQGQKGKPAKMEKTAQALNFHVQKPTKKI